MVITALYFLVFVLVYAYFIVDMVHRDKFGDAEEFAVSLIAAAFWPAILVAAVIHCIRKKGKRHGRSRASMQH